MVEREKGELKGRRGRGLEKRGLKGRVGQDMGQWRHGKQWHEITWSTATVQFAAYAWGVG